MAFQTSAVQTFIVNGLAKHLSKKLDARISIEKVDISFFNKVIIHGFLVEDQKEDTLFHVKKLVASINDFSTKNKTVNLSSVEMINTKVFVSLDENRFPNYKFLIDALRSSSDSVSHQSWSIACRNFIFDDTRVGYSYYQQNEINLIDLNNIHLSVTDFSLGRDSIYMKIDELNFDDNNLLFINNLSTTIVSFTHVIKLSDLSFSTPNSKVSGVNFMIDQSELSDKADYTASAINLEVGNSDVDLRDVAMFIPAIRGMDLRLGVSGNVSGTIGNLKTKDLKVSFGKHTSLACDLYINGLPDVNSAYLSIDLKELSTDFKDIAGIRLPNSFSRPYPDFPSFLFDAGVITYEGNFTGFISNFVAYGTLRSNYGRLTTDLSFVPAAENNSLEMKGHLKTVNFKLGSLVRHSELGNITFDGNINGSYRERSKSFTAELKGVVDSLMYKSYMYRNMLLDGSFDDRKFEGSFRVDDPNVKAMFTGKADMNTEIPVFDFRLLLEKADLAALNIDGRHKISNLAFDMKANFTGNNIDNIEGNIWCEEGQYANENDSIKLNSLSFSTFSSDEALQLTLKSDFLDASVKGSYSFHTLKDGIFDIICRHLPGSGITPSTLKGQNNFSLNIDLKNPVPLTATFIPALRLSPAQAELHFNENANTARLYASVPELRYNRLLIKGYTISLNADDRIEFKSRLSELQTNNKSVVQNLALLADADANIIDTKLVWSNNDEKTYSGELEVEMRFPEWKKEMAQKEGPADNKKLNAKNNLGRKHSATAKEPDYSTDNNKKGLLERLEALNLPHIDIKILPTKIYIADTLWSVHHSTATIDSSRMEINDFIISNKEQSITVTGALSKDKTDRLNISIANFNMHNFNLFGEQDIDIAGVMNGTASIFDVYEKALFLADLHAEGFAFNGHHLGDISLLCKMDRPSESLITELKVTDRGHVSLYGSGNYFPANNTFSFTALTDSLSLSPLQMVLKKSFSNIGGFGTGEMKIYGSPGNVMLRGDIFGENAGLTVNFLNTHYTFSDTVSFRGDSIVFDNIRIYDKDGNRGTFTGSIRHENFSNMVYDLSLRTPKMLILNTTVRDNDICYGQGYGRGELSITGRGKDIYLNGSVRTLAGTSINISLDYGREAQVYNFIRFVNKQQDDGEHHVEHQPEEGSRLFMKFNIEATPDARMQLDYNSRIGDVIRARGSGNLQIVMNHNEDLALYGNYEIDNGDYLFTLQNVISKKFDIEKGGTLYWNGDPENAIINLAALYRLRTSLVDLFAGNTTTDIAYNQRLNVTLKIALTDQLTRPAINFDIDFPSAEERLKDEVRQFFSTEEDMNKQILSLLVLGRFYTPEYMRGSYEASNPNLVGTTAGDLFSSQLSSWLSQINKDWDIGINYRPGSAISNDEVELALSTQIFNDRVTINGNIGNNGTAANTANNSNIVGDFDINVKLTNNGKLQFKAYNHSNNNILYETSPYTQGIGLSYTESYDTTHELWQKFKSLFRPRRSNIRGER